MSFILLTDQEEIKILESILEFLKNPSNVLGIQDGPLPLFKIGEYYVTDIALLNTLRVETEESYAEIISSAANLALFEEICHILRSTVGRIQNDEKRLFLAPTRKKHK